MLDSIHQTKCPTSPVFFVGFLRTDLIDERSTGKWLANRFILPFGPLIEAISTQNNTAPHIQLLFGLHWEVFDHFLLI